MDSNEESASSLAAHTLSCRNEFSKMSSDVDNTWARDQMAQFNMWTANIGVLAKGHQSLAYRLKDIPEIVALILQLLCALEKNLVRNQITIDNLVKDDRVLESKKDLSLDDCRSRCSSTSSYDFASDSESEPEQTEAALPNSRVAAQEIIDRLHRLSAIIRRSGAHHRQVRIKHFLEKRKNIEVHDMIKRLARQKVEFLFPKAESFLHERIAESIAKRRSRFLYIKQHQQKVSTQNIHISPRIPKAMPAEVDVEPIPNLPHPVEKRDLESPLIFGNSTVGQSVLSATVDTKLDLKRLRIARNERPETVISVSISQGGYPKPPKMPAGAISFECLYCRLEYPAEEARESLWQQHLVKDFEPYFCLFKDCKDPFEPSDSFNTWIAHMHEYHMLPRWHCMSPHQDPKSFSRVQEFEDHIRTHDENIADNLLATLTKHSVSRDTQIFQSCPFCGGLPHELVSKFPDQTTGDAQLALQKHVRDDLLKIALILPPIPDMDEEDGQVGGSSALGPRESVLGSKEATIFPETHCDLKGRETPCDCRDEKKNSSSNWSTTADTVVPFWTALDPKLFFKSSEPKSFDDPAWRPESQPHVSELGGEWEFCDFRKPHYNELDDPIILHLIDQVSLRTSVPQALMDDLNRAVDAPNMAVEAIPAAAASKIIIAVDFGTTCSSLGYIHTSEPEGKIIRVWPDSVQTTEWVPTTIEYDEDDPTSYKWGYQLEDDERKHEWFKLGLNPTLQLTGLAQKYKSHTARPMVRGEECERLVTDYLKGLKGHAEQYVRDEWGPEIVPKNRKPQYIITVPAVWSEKAQATIRQCAESAGMGNRNNIQTITELEAAGIYALKSMKLSLKVDDTFVLCDAGGGTVELISYTVAELGKIPLIHEAAPGSGGLCGSTFLNRIFDAYLTQKFANYGEWDSVYHQDAMHKFEVRVKREFNGDLRRSIFVPAPSLSANPALGIANGQVEITGIELHTIFEPVIAEILALVNAQIKATRPKVITAVLLAGRFGRSEYLKKKIQEEVGDTRVITIENGGTAIVRGALIRGLAERIPKLATSWKAGWTGAGKRPTSLSTLRYHSPITITDMLIDDTLNELESTKFAAKKELTKWGNKRSDYKDDNKPVPLETEKNFTACETKFDDAKKNHEAALEDFCRKLLAPRHVRFFNQKWQEIGAKSSLGRLISDITGVPEAVLLVPPKKKIQEFPIAARISWIAKRHTTRIEDMSYSLLGILNINMPMLYGEGQKAFLRLQEEIIKKYNDLSIFAWNGAATASGFMPILAASPASFVINPIDHQAEIPAASKLPQEKLPTVTAPSLFSISLCKLDLASALRRARISSFALRSFSKGSEKHR
ncbi:uncharacterized protein PAC_17440 [Phialocephala subalpina]|uniref:DUF8212 domain-containing protein n=1 Tax=Phialocephala subalpina TaxID=576137 RepID=A0A1L7XR54_9HELO|nr:uncharacterized protein PAC_17440 [Phialocephala subalpina]